MRSISLYIVRQQKTFLPCREVPSCLEKTISCAGCLVGHSLHLLADERTAMLLGSPLPPLLHQLLETQTARDTNHYNIAYATS